MVTVPINENSNKRNHWLALEAQVSSDECRWLFGNALNQCNPPPNTSLVFGKLTGVEPDSAKSLSCHRVNLPRQVDGFSCGVLALMWIIQQAGIVTPHISGENADECRLFLAQIYLNIIQLSHLQLTSCALYSCFHQLETKQQGSTDSVQNPVDIPTKIDQDYATGYDDEDFFDAFTPDFSNVPETPTASEKDKDGATKHFTLFVEKSLMIKFVQ
ncbi:hypothetical protein HDV05_006634, partial [Chytridiales sp. JEL 0842]